MKRIYGGKSIQVMIHDLVNQRPNITVTDIVQALGKQSATPILLSKNSFNKD